MEQRCNLELKVRLTPAELATRREMVIAACDRPLQRLQQIDTYFRTSRGRLKLREIQTATGTAAELIAYHRSDRPSARWSSYDRVPIAPAEAPILKRGLLATLGELVVVDKTRDVGILGHSRIHLDTVAGLGTFLEIETVIAGQDPATAPAELAALVARLRLDPFPPIGESYSDLLLAHRSFAPYDRQEEQA